MRFGFLLNEVLTGLRRNVTMTVAMILTTAISIGLFGGGLLVVRLADTPGRSTSTASRRRSSSPRTSPPTTRTARPPRVRRCANKIEARQRRQVGAVHQSAGRLQRRHAQGAGVQGVASKDEFPASFVVKLNNPEQHTDFDDAMRGQPGVRGILNQKDLIDRLFAVLDGLRNAAFAVALVQAVGAILLIANMVQVAAYTRRTEIGIMRLVGASRWYTQLPFLVEAMLAATLGVAIAIARPGGGAGIVPGQRAEPVLPSQPDRQGRLRRHPLHRAVAVSARRVDGRR